MNSVQCSVHPKRPRNESKAHCHDMMTTMAGDILLLPNSIPGSTISKHNPEKSGNLDSVPNDPSSDTEKSRSSTAKKYLKRVTLNVSGNRFVTLAKTLRRMPGTRLGDLTEFDESYDPDEDEHFFDRNPVIFYGILDFYRTGELHFPHNICARVVKNELLFWRIDDKLLSECCWQAYNQSESTTRSLCMLAGAFGPLNGVPSEKTDSQWQRLKRVMWNFLEFPRSSKAAKIWALFYAFTVSVSIFVTIFETLDVFRVPDPERFAQYLNISRSTKETQVFSTNLNTGMIVLELTSGAILTIEFVIRFIVCPSKVNFIRSPMAWLEALSLTMLWLVAAYYTILPVSSNEQIMVFSGALCLRNMRVLRVFRIARYFPGWTILILSLKNSIWEMLVLMSFVLTGVLVFAVLIYSAQFWSQDEFTGVPIGFWWAIVTMTTVGYGDFYPTTVPGYIIGAMCALTGMLATGLPIPIIANNFNTLNTFYKMWKSRESKGSTLLWGIQSPEALLAVNLAQCTTDKSIEDSGQTIPATDDYTAECQIGSSTDLTAKEC